MGLYVGESEIAGVYIGDYAASAVYMGSNQIWSASVYPGLNSYSVSELSAIACDLSAGYVSHGVNTSVYYDEFCSYIGQTYDFGAMNISCNVAADKRVISQLVGICHDDLADGTGKAGLTFLRTNAHPYSKTAKYGEYSENNYGGWASSNLKSFTALIATKLPQDLQDAVKQVGKLTNNTGGTSVTVSDVTSTTETVWLPSIVELYGTPPAEVTGYDILDAEGSQYDLFAAEGVTWTTYSFFAGRGVTNSGGEYVKYDNYGTIFQNIWWLRSPSSETTRGYHCVYRGGGPGAYTPNCSMGIVFGFCLGSPPVQE